MLKIHCNFNNFVTQTQCFAAKCLMDLAMRSERKDDTDKPQQINDSADLTKHQRVRSKSLETIAVCIDDRCDRFDVSRKSHGQNSSDSVDSSSTSTVPGIFSLETLDSLYLCPIPDFPPSLARLNSYRNYELLDYHGTRVFYACERGSCCLPKFFCSESRGFEIDVYDLQGKVVLNVSRLLSWSLFLCGIDTCCNCCNETTATGGTTFFGRVTSSQSSSRPRFMIQDSEGVQRFTIRGPKYSYCLICKLCGITQFPICLPDSETSLGKIKLGYDGLNDENVPHPGTTSVIFPPNCTPEMKCLLVAAGFMLDIAYFHRRGCTGSRFIRRILTVLLILLSIGGLFFVFVDSAVENSKAD